MPRIEQLKPVLRAMACKLDESAARLGPMNSNLSYKLALRMSIENKVENLMQEIPNCSLVYNPPLPNLPLNPRNSEEEPITFQDSINKIKKKFYTDIQNKLSEFEKEISPVRVEFTKGFEPFVPYLGFIVEIVNQNPKYIEELGMYKEEAITLSNIFLVLSDESHRLVDVELINNSQGNLIIVEDPISIRVYKHVSNFFKDLARKSPSYNEVQGQTVKGYLEQIKFKPEGGREQNP